MIQHHRRGSEVAARALAGLFLLILTSVTAVQAKLDPTTQKPYYGQKLYEDLSSKSRYPELKSDLRRILASAHSSREGEFDEIDSSCRSEGCYRHEDLGYKEGRRYLFGKIHLKGDERRYWLVGVYCSEVYSSDNFPRGAGPGPMRIPNHHVVNAEHTWPQSKFNQGENGSMQKSDLHNLYPTNSKVNSNRGNHEFAEVDDVISSDCPGTALGYAQGGHGVYFEPPDHHKGNVARSLFYFSTRYDMRISDFQESFLRRWHKLDPVDQEELDRAEMIFEIQKVRNPYIDHPELADLVENF